MLQYILRQCPTQAHTRIKKIKVFFLSPNTVLRVKASVSELEESLEMPSVTSMA